MLERARSALADLGSNDRDRTVTGVYLALFGQAQRLEHIATYDRQHFGAWWPTRIASVADDPICRFFTRVRNAFLKEGTLFHAGRNVLVTVTP
jgi:hypothetical protein